MNYGDQRGRIWEIMAFVSNDATTTRIKWCKSTTSQILHKFLGIFLTACASLLFVFNIIKYGFCWCAESISLNWIIMEKGCQCSNIAKLENQHCSTDVLLRWKSTLQCRYITRMKTNSAIQIYCLDENQLCNTDMLLRWNLTLQYKCIARTKINPAMHLYCLDEN